MAFSANADENSFSLILTKASNACVKTSIPVSAVICGGTLRTNSASKIASSGSKLGEINGYFICRSGSVITAKEVTSEPVPLVVGIAIKGILGYPSVVIANSRIAFEASIAEPPPTAIKTSG